MTTERLPADDPEAVLRAIHALDHGELVLYPTDTLYGVGADALDAEAVSRVFEAKDRPTDAPLPVLVGDVEGIHHVAILTPLARRLAARHLPGALTLVLPARGTVPSELVAGGDTVAVRIPDAPFARRLAGRFGPVTATSANLHGEAAPATAHDAERQLGDRASLVVDGGRLPGTASTIVDATGDTPKVIRVGAFPPSKLVDPHG